MPVVANSHLNILVISLYLKHFLGNISGLEIRGCWEPRAPLDAPADPNICREPKYVLFDIHNTFMKLMKMQLGSLEKILILSPVFEGELFIRTIFTTLIDIFCELMLISKVIF